MHRLFCWLVPTPRLLTSHDWYFYGIFHVLLSSNTTHFDHLPPHSITLFGQIHSSRGSCYFYLFNTRIICWDSKTIISFISTSKTLYLWIPTAIILALLNRMPNSSMGSVTSFQIAHDKPRNLQVHSYNNIRLLRSLSIRPPGNGLRRSMCSQD